MTERRHRSPSLPDAKAERRRSRSPRASHKTKSGAITPRKMQAARDGEPFHVPYRCLVPLDSSGAIIGKGAIALKKLEDECGVHVAVKKSSDGPRDIDDRVCVINGTFDQKTEGLDWVLSRVRESLRLSDSDRAITVCIIPESLTSIVIGPKGATIRRIEDKCDVGIKIVDDSLRGTGDKAVTVRGTKRDTIHAFRLIHERIEEDILLGRIRQKDFQYCMYFPAIEKRSSSPTLPPTPPSDYISGETISIVITHEEADRLSETDYVEEISKFENVHGIEILLTSDLNHEVVELVGTGIEFKKKCGIIDQLVKQFIPTDLVKFKILNFDPSVIEKVAGTPVVDGIVAVPVSRVNALLTTMEYQRYKQRDSTVIPSSEFTHRISFNIHPTDLKLIESVKLGHATVTGSTLTLEGTPTSITKAVAVLLEAGFGRTDNAEDTPVDEHHDIDYGV
jgi:hypothetical protein